MTPARSQALWRTQKRVRPIGGPLVCSSSKGMCSLRQHSLHQRHSQKTPLLCHVGLCFLECCQQQQQALGSLLHSWPGAQKNAQDLL